MIKSGTQSAVLALFGLVCIALSFFLSPSHSDRFFHSYLFGYLFWFDLSLGALSLLMIGHLTGGVWRAATFRIHQAMAATLPGMALLFIPILLGMHHIYPWLKPEWASDPKVIHKSLYLNVAGFGLRALIYFGCWIALAFIVREKPLLPGGEEDLLKKARLRTFSAAGLVIYALTSSFSSFEWKMSLEPLWFSTIFGMITCAAQALVAMAVSLWMYSAMSHRSNAEHTLSQKLQRDLGNLLLATVMVWTYLSFMQFLVIWSGNLPEESPYYVHRGHGGWVRMAAFLFSLGFGIPFLALLFRRAKDNLKILGMIAALVSLMTIIDHYWTTMPSLYPDAISVHWLDFSLFAGIGALWFSGFLAFMTERAEARP